MRFLPPAEHARIGADAALDATIYLPVYTVANPARVRSARHLARASLR
jgi:hypothetical protein